MGGVSAPNAKYSLKDIEMPNSWNTFKNTTKEEERQTNRL
jgi:hypothetical protein